MANGLQYYLRKIEALRIGRAHNAPAPHKPLLLLAVIDLIEDPRRSDSVEKLRQSRVAFTR